MNFARHAILALMIFTASVEPLPAAITQDSPAETATNTNRGKLRAPQKRVPELVAPEQPDRTRDRIRREFEGLDPNDARFFQTLERLWSQALAVLPKNPLPSAAQAGISKGSILPTEVQQLLGGRGTNETIPQLQNSPTRESGRMLTSLGWMAGAWGGNHIPKLIANRLDHLPPDESDLAIFFAVNLGIADMDPATNRPMLENWKPLIKAKNPLYRLLAVRAGIHAVPRDFLNVSVEDPRHASLTAPAMAAFYKAFLSDTDPLILKEAVKILSIVGDASAKSTLIKFREKQQTLGNVELVMAANEAISACESRLPTKQ